VSHALHRFLDTLDIPLLATLRDTQNYVRCAQLGVGIFEMADNDSERDKETWRGLIDWLEAKSTGPAYQDNRSLIV
jgi:chromosome partitioning protein